MTPERRQEIEALFETALAQPDDQRDAWLAARCAGDGALGAAVRALLDAHHRAGGILDADAGPAARRVLGSPMRDRRIGAYRVLRELGRGGMGVVYLAERDDGQFRRRVAIKLLRNSPDAEELHHRFLAERQILASLDHPNIAQLLDAGVTDGQLPYLVMECVDGLPITEFCNRHRLGIAARLRLFQAVCAAVHHAHRNLVIHRDLKPSNILVVDDGTVKLLDFGIAKLLNPGMSAMAMPVTRTERRVMTPEYASPEQVRGESLTTASDVYALGVVLYELLSGHRPYRLTTGSPEELTQLVCEREPERPSLRAGRVETLAPDDGGRSITPELVAEARGVSVERLRRQLRGDLDAIVMMALRKEAGRRYGSAELLEQDVQRHLDGLPVAAHRGSRWYRAGKLLGRHRVEAAAAAVVLLALVAGVGMASWQAREAGRARDRATAALEQAERARAQSDEITAFLMGLFEVNDPEIERGDTITARELLRRGVAHAEQLSGEPLVQARLLEVAGQVYRSLGDYTQSRALLERSLSIRRRELGDEHVDVAGSLFHLADALRRQGRYADAEAAARQSLEIRRGALGRTHPDVAESLVLLSRLVVYRADLAEAEQLARDALAVRRVSLPNDDVRIAGGLELLGAVLRRRGLSREAEDAFREAHALRVRQSGPGDPEVGYVLLRIADIVAQDREEPAEAESLYRRGLAVLRGALGAEHPRVAWAMGDLGSLLADRGALGEAESLYRGALDIHERAFGAEHVGVAQLSTGLGGVLARAGRLDEAERLQREAMRIWEQAVGTRHSATIGALGGLAAIIAEQGRLDESERLYREALARRRDDLGEVDTPLLAILNGDLAGVVARQARFAEADSLYQWSLATLRRHTPDTHRDIRRLHVGLSALYEAWGRPADASRHRQLATAR